MKKIGAIHADQAVSLHKCYFGSATIQVSHQAKTCLHSKSCVGLTSIMQQSQFNYAIYGLGEDQSVYLNMYLGLCFVSRYILPIYSPKTPIPISCTPPRNKIDTISDG